MIRPDHPDVVQGGDCSFGDTGRTGLSDHEKNPEIRLSPESVEALARRLAELLGPKEESRKPRELISAEAVSEWWGVGRRWVYDHADELGARRLGTGKRPRLRFDPEEVAERLGVPDDRGGRDAR